MNRASLFPRRSQLLDWAVIAGSVWLCSLLSLARLPGMELLGIGPNWLLIWVVSWSLNRTPFQGAIAGVVLGLLYDSLTAAYPSQAVSFGLVGCLTACLQKPRYLQENFASVALIAFAMVAIAEAVTAVQYSLQGVLPLAEIWASYQRIALSSAILSSLWAPALYYPLNGWWNRNSRAPISRRVRH